VDNPYQAPEAGWAPEPDDALAVTPRPTAATVLAILGLIYGGLGLLCNPLNALGNMLAANVPPPDDPISRVGFEPTYRQGIVVFSAVGFLACVLLIAACVGLLMRSRWGRALGLAYGSISLVAALAFLVFSMIFFFGPLNDLAAQANTLQEKGRFFGAIFGAGFVALLWFVFPIVTLYLLNTPKVVEAYRARK
jgi:hypothetical protein